MGLFDSNSSSSSVGATDTARVLSGKNATLSESGSVAISGKGGKYLSPNSLDLAGARITTSENRGLQIGTGARVGNIAIGDGGAAAAALAQDFTTALTNLVESGNQTLSNLVSNQGAQVSSALQSLGELSQRRAETDAASTDEGKQKFFLWLALGGLALVALTFFFRRA